MSAASLPRGVSASLFLALAAVPAAWVPAQDATSPTTPAAATKSAPPPGGGGGGRGGRGGPLSADDQAAITKLGALPEWKAGAGSGDYSLGPTYTPAPEGQPRDNGPKGKVVSFTMEPADSKFFTAPYAAGATPAAREVFVYIPANYVPGTPAPLLVAHDAMGMRDRQPAPHLPTILDNLIAEKRLPPMVAVMLMHGAQRSVEYDTVSGKYAEFVEAEVLPRIEKDYGVTFAKDPNARATLGGSSGGAAALSMAWFHPELYRRVLVYSGTFVNLRNGPDAPHGAWEYHENFIPKAPAKPLRLWLQVGERDNGANSGSAGMGNWVIANQRMADVLKAKGYAYQFVFCKEAGHVDRPARAQTLAPALEWLWQDYRPAVK